MMVHNKLFEMLILEGAQAGFCGVSRLLKSPSDGNVLRYQNSRQSFPFGLRHT
jgi:hypothetical protein